MSAKEKSDLPEVAEKRANKAALAAAELVERRGGAKENAELQSAVRTQSWEAVSQAQARIREAVNRKTEGVECLTKFFIADGLPTIGMQRTSDGVERGLIHETSPRVDAFCFCFQSGRMNSSRRICVPPRGMVKPQVIGHTINHPKILSLCPGWQIAVQKDVTVGPTPLEVKPV